MITSVRDLQAIPGSGGRRSSRERQATPFVKDFSSLAMFGLCSLGHASRSQPPTMNVHAASLRQTPDLTWKEEDVPNNVRTVQFSGPLASEA